MDCVYKVQEHVYNYCDRNLDKYQKTKLLLHYLDLLKYS